MLLGLVIYVIATICSPGAANLLAAESGARVGVRRSSGLLLGLAVAVLGIVALCAAGIGALVTAAPAVRLALRVVGSLYLLWLAWKILRSHRKDAEEEVRPSTFLTGVLSTIVNPKSWTVGLGAAASFSRVAPTPALLTLSFVTVFAAIVVPNLIVWAWLGHRIDRWLVTDRRRRWYSAALSGLLVLSVVTLWIE